MPRILAAKEIFHIQGAALAFVQRLDALVYLSANCLELFDMREQFSADLFLIGVREPGNLRDGLFERSNHEPRLARQKQKLKATREERAGPNKSRVNPKADAAMAVLLPGGPTPNRLRREAHFVQCNVIVCI